MAIGAVAVASLVIAVSVYSRPLFGSEASAKPGSYKTKSDVGAKLVPDCDEPNQSKEVSKPQKSLRMKNVGPD
jgi:hypothetical protein